MTDDVDPKLLEGLSRNSVVTAKNFAVFHSAGKGAGFFDIDNVMGDAEYREALLDELVSDIEGMDAEFNKLVFLDKDYGPTGLLPAATELSSRLDTDFAILKLWDSLRFDHLKVKGEQIRYGDSVLLLDDVITTGNTQERAIDIIDNQGGRVAAIYSVLTRQPENVERFEADGVECESLLSLDDVIHMGLTFPKSPDIYEEKDLVSEYRSRVDGEYSASELESEVDSRVSGLLDRTEITASEDVEESLRDLYFQSSLYLTDMP